jgi:hypothetical protein
MEIYFLPWGLRGKAYYDEEITFYFAFFLFNGYGMGAENERAAPIGGGHYR